MRTVQLPGAAHAEQLEGAGELRAEDADRLLHPALPAVYQPVQERPADQAGFRAKGQDAVANGRSITLPDGKEMVMFDVPPRPQPK